MSRATIALDRLVVLVLGLLLVAAGAATLLWWYGPVDALPAPLRPSGPIQLDRVQSMLTETWFPWVAALVGLALVLLGSWWLLAHVPQRGVGDLRLPGSGSTGQLRAQAKQVAAAAADQLEATPGIRSASGSIQHERGQLVAKLGALVEPDADLAAVSRACDRVSAELATVLERDDLHCQVNLRVAGRGRSEPRVR